MAPCLGRDWGRRRVVFVWTWVRCCEEHGSACELRGPWLAPGLGSRRLLLLQILPPTAQITYQTLILFKSVITEQNWVPAPCVYFLIRCLANRRPQFEFTRTQCPSSWPALVTGRSSQPLGAQVVVITALFHLRSGYGFRLFCPPLKMDVQEKALNEFVSHDTRLFPLLSIPFPSKTLSGMISVPCKKAQIIF